MTDKVKLERRNFLKQAAGTLGASAQMTRWPLSESPQSENSRQTAAPSAGGSVHFPRQFRDRQLKMLSFRLGDVAASSIGSSGSRPAIWIGRDLESPLAGALTSHHAERSRGVVFNNLSGFLPPLCIYRFCRSSWRCTRTMLDNYRDAERFRLRPDRLTAKACCSPDN